MATLEAKVTSKGQITLPAKLRALLMVEAGDHIVFSETPDGTFRVETMHETFNDLKRLIRSGPSITSEDVANWIKEARDRAVPEGLRKTP